MIAKRNPIANKGSFSKIARRFSRPNGQKSSNSITAGSDFYSFHISTPVDAVDYIEAVSFQNRVSHNARSYISGSFIENKLQLTNTLKLVCGIRYDYGTVYEGDVYNTQQDEERNEEKHALSGNIAAAFRMNKYSFLFS